MNLQSKQMAEYFKERPAYKRLLKGIRIKYINLGEIKGNIVISNPSKEEKQVLSGLMKKDYSKNKNISINVKVLEKRIKESKFSGANLKEIIEEYFSEDIITKKESNNNYEIELEDFFEQILNKNINTQMYPYLEEIIKNKNDIYYNLKKHYNKDKEKLKTAILNACEGINNLPEEKIRIPVFASNITGDPHGFDKNTLCGKIFLMFICYIEKIKIPKTIEEFAEIYYQHNLLIDDISNMVLCKNITGYAPDKDFIPNEFECASYVRHLGLKGFAKYNKPIYLSLYNLSNISFLDKYHKYKEVIVMENPTVFMEVSERSNKKDFPIICTYGQVKLSGLILLDMLIEQNYKIYYSGDIDPEGIQIADKLKERYNKNLKFIGFDVNTYKRNLSNVELSENRLKKLEKIKSKELQDICNEVSKTKKASYEKKNIDEIINFINNL